MGKIKNFIQEQKTDLKALIHNYTLTIISVALLSIVFCIALEMDTSTDFVRNTELFLLMFAIGALFVETFFVEKNQPKNWKKLIVFYVVDIVLATIWTLIGHFDNEIANLFEYKDIYYLNLTKILAVYITVLVVFFLYKTIKLSGLKLDTYVSRAIFGLLKMWGLFFVLYMAICMLLSIFESLIMDIDYWDILDNLTVLILGFVCFPYSLLMITETKDENSKFTKGLINVVLMPAVIIALLIVYLYIIKILVTFEMPSNEVFGICLSVFVLGGPVWFMSYGFLREKALANNEQLGQYAKLVKNMKYAYAPLIILEIISIGIRIVNYGLTTQRYLAIVAIVFQIIYVLWDVIGKVTKKDLKEEGLIFVGLFIFVFALLCPGLNMNKLPANVQIARFEDALESEDYVTAGAIYKYLDSYECDYGEVYLDQRFTVAEREDLEQIFYDYAEDENEYNYTEYVRAYVPAHIEDKGISIKGFTNIYRFNYYKNYDNTYTMEELKSITISYGDNFEVANVNLATVANFALGLKEDDINYSQEMEYQYIEISENCTIVVEDIDFRYNKYTEEISGLSVSGYVLTNEGGHNGQ